MLAYIEGKIIQKNPENFIISVQGVGFQINCDAALAAQFPPIGEEAKVWTYMNVRENEISLFGFPSQEMKSLFELLITVSGIGPKVAGTIVANISSDAFALAVLNDNYEILTRIKGIGKKGAQRIILELKDKLKKSMPAIEKVQKENEEFNNSIVQQGFVGARNEAIAALVVLGYGEREAEQAVAKAISDMQNNEQEVTLEALLKNALKFLVRL